jgi:predicted phage terminase large subunit-like protein
VSRTKQPNDGANEPSKLRAPQLEIRLPPLHPKQQEVATSPARFKVVVCGRQWGKTTVGAIECVKVAAAGGSAWWVGPSYPIGQLGWDIIDRLCRQVPGVKFLGRPDNIIRFPTGGTIQLRSADNPDSLRGSTLDLVVFDEAAFAKPEAWPYLRPTLSVKRGKALFISTPRGLNWFHDLYQDAQGRKNWETWRTPSLDNPWMPEEDVELAREEMSSLLFSQEYEAEFISLGTGMFRADWIQHFRSRFEGDERVLLLGEEAVELSACRTFSTVDLAWTLEEDADFTVISSWAVTPRKHLVLLDMIRGRFEGPDIIPRLRAAWDKWGGVLYVERAGRQMQIVQEAVRTGLPVRELKADKDKIARALPATARMEQMRVWFPEATTPWFRDIEEEMLAFPAGRHDDFVDTLAYAVIVAAGGSAYADHDFFTV